MATLRNIATKLTEKCAPSVNHVGLFKPLEPR